MTGDRTGIDHVIDAIDNALAWTEPWADAMTVQYGDNGDGAPEDVAASPGHHPMFYIQDGVRVAEPDMGRPWWLAPQHSFIDLYAAEDDAMPRVGEGQTWFDEPHGGPVEPGWPEGWREGGYITDGPAAFTHDDGDGDTEEIWSMDNPVPLRVVSYHHMPPGLMMIGHLPQGFDLSPHVSAASFGFDAEALRDGMRRAGESVRGFGDELARSAAAVNQHWAPLMLDMARSLRFAVSEIDPETMRLAFGSPGNEGPTGPQDPRERALQARRNRNTGPVRNPHRHRGI